MKTIFLTLCLGLMAIGTLSASAGTIREKRFKAEMLTRADALSIKLAEAHKDLETENVKAACEKIIEIFPIYKEHALDIGVRMDPFDHKSAEIRNDSLSELITLDQEKLTCEKGKDSEYVDPLELQKKLRSILKSLKKQKKLIEKKNTGFENFYQYEYDFSR